MYFKENFTGVDKMYEIEIYHKELHKYRKITGKEKYVVEQKALMQKRQWEDQWQQKLQRIEEQEKKERLVYEKEQKKLLAEELSSQAQEVLNSLENILNFTLNVDDRIDWESLKDTRTFPNSGPNTPKYIDSTPKPTEEDPKYKPQLSIFAKLIPKIKNKKAKEIKKIYEEDLRSWEKEQEHINRRNTQLNDEYKEAIKQWEIEKLNYEERQEHNNNLIDEFTQAYFDGDYEAIIEYCDMVLANSEYPDSFPQQFELEYIELTKTLIIEYQLPSANEIPVLKEVKYIQSKNEFKEVHLSETSLNKLYDSIIYQIVLRTIHEIFESDVINAIDSVIMNGWVNTIDKGTGKEINICIASVQTSKGVFGDINLKNVDPKICFKNLKGVASTKLHSLTPIAPLLQVSKEDKRFVSSYNVAENIDQSVNLAAMDWQDFEHLIRELFDKEFNSSGGEVKITRASKDGGVDAVAFDPDPIRGGKIVIQAKRYTNAVGVSAVRDLYGTVLNEGANKGILVTTADYGPDAYEFVKDKPLTLLNGNNLLYLLEKHGHKAKIDLKEAKRK